MRFSPFICLLPLLGAIPYANATSAIFTDFTLYQEHSIAPRFVSPATTGWNDYVDNLRAGATSSGFVNTGDSATPGYFSTVDTEITLSNMVTTGSGVSTPTDRRFNSWLSKTDPGIAFNPAFADEWGNSLHTPFLLVTSGGAITVNSIDRTFTSVADPSYAAARTGTWTTWSQGRTGVVSYGGDGVLGGGDDTYVNSGAMNSTPVLAVIGTGIGHSFSINKQFDGTPWPETTPDEEIYGEYFDQYGEFVWDIQTEYTVNYEKGASGPLDESLPGDDIEVVPEPSAFVLSIASAFGLLVIRRRS